MAIIRTDPFREFDRLTQQLLGMTHGPRALSMPKTLVETPEQGVSVIRNHGPNPTLMATLWRIWDEDNGTREAGELFCEFEKVAGLPPTVRIIK